jgi:hypothetical protein
MQMMLGAIAFAIMAVAHVLAVMFVQHERAEAEARQPVDRRHAVGSDSVAWDVALSVATSRRSR